MTGLTGMLALVYTSSTKGTRDMLSMKHTQKASGCLYMHAKKLK